MAYKRTKVVVKLSFSSLHVSFSATDLLHHLAGNLVYYSTYSYSTVTKVWFKMSLQVLHILNTIYFIKLNRLLAGLGFFLYH